jgi:hypothetical protein
MLLERRPGMSCGLLVLSSDGLQVLSSDGGVWPSLYLEVATGLLEGCLTQADLPSGVFKRKVEEVCEILVVDLDVARQRSIRI